MHNIIDVKILVRQQNRKLIVMGISKVFLYVAMKIHYPLFLLEIIISSHIIPNENVQYLPIENFIQNTAVLLLLLINNTTPFYSYLI
jgi:hypothetical protein